MVESILHQGAGPGRYNVTSVTLRFTLLKRAILKGMVQSVRYLEVGSPMYQQQQHQMLYLHDHKGITVLQKLLV